MFARFGAIKHSRRFSLDASKVPPILPDINYASLTVQRTDKPKPKLPNEELKFGKSFSDHLLEVDWDNTNGWHAPRIIPYQNFSLDPASSVFHYALEAFEGMKAYRDSKNPDMIRMFRPDMNMKRLNSSCEQLFFPKFDEEQFLECIKELIRTDKDWVPTGDGYSLYLRPTIISTHEFLGVAASEKVKLYVILSPVGPYYPEGFNAVSLLADPKFVRAWPGGSGATKIGGNYAPTIRVQREAAAQGFSQILWLFGEEEEVTEVGTMNQFFFWEKPGGGRELVTAPLDGTILPGVTRDSVLTLMRDWNEFEVNERPYTMKEVISALEEGRLLEAFGSGTAAILSPVKQIGYKGTRYSVPLDPNNPSEQAGPLCRRLFNKVLDIQYGREPYRDWSVLI